MCERRFGGLVAVNDVSFDVEAGEILGLIGPNGAGKSTMFNLLTGALRPNAGAIVFAGQDIIGAAASTHRPRRHRAHLPAREAAPAHDRARQRAARRLSPRLRAGVFARRAAPRPREEDARPRRGACASWSASASATAPFDLAGNLPLGKQRVLEIARALVADPVLLVLDEPAAGLRRQEKLALAELLRSLRAKA